MKKIIIFDLDGTLFDTTGAMAACGNHALSLLGLPTFTPGDYALFSGGGIEGYVNAVLEAAGDKEHRHFDAFWRTYLEKNATLGKEANVPYPHIREVLDALKERGVCLAVLSNKDQASCEQIVKDAFGEGTFLVIRGDRGDLPVKPHPAGVFDVLAQCGMEKEAALYVGDTQVDIQTGKAAGIETAAALWGYRPRNVLEAEKPDHLIASPLDILELCK